MPEEPRVVSLIASATEILHALGFGASQVGRSHECDYPPAVDSLEVCTRPRFAVSGDSREIDRRVKESLRDAVSVYEVFDEALERLRPTHILTQTQCEVCAVSLQDVERALASRVAGRPTVVALEPNSLADVWSDIRRVARALGAAGRGESLVAGLQARMLEISERARRAGPRPRTACIEWIEPLMAAGNWTPELVEMAGGENLFGRPGAHAPWMSWEDLEASDPDVIVVAPCGFDLERTRQEMYWLTQRQGWEKLRAVRSRRVYVADGNAYFNRPGPRLVETLELLEEMLRGRAEAGAGRWERL